MASPQELVFDWKKDFDRGSLRLGPSWTDYMISTMRSAGFASQNRFLVLLFPNENIRQKLGMNFVRDTTRLATMCKSVTVEAKSWFTAEEKVLSPGADRIMPYKKNTANTTGFKLVFNCGADMFEKELFESWMDCIQDPETKEMSFYDYYAFGSQAYLLLLPNSVRNMEQVMGAMNTNRLSGYRLTEIYPYSVGIPTLNTSGGTEPLSVEVGMMFRDVYSASAETRKVNPEPMAVYETGYPVLPRTAEYDELLLHAMNGHAVKKSREKFNQNRQKEEAVYRKYVDELWNKNRIKQNLDLPKAVDGRVVYETPRFGGLQLGASLIQQVAGLF